MPKRTDANQKAIVEELRKFGSTVQILSETGKGCPDILVGYHNRNYLFEIKAPGGKMTKPEWSWHQEWKGRVYIIRTFEQAWDILTTDDEQ